MKYFIILIALMSNSIASDYQIHILEEGETLSEILLSHGYTPLYGKDQWVQKTLDMNHLKSVNAKEIKKGLPVILPQRDPKLSSSSLNKKKIYTATIVSPRPKMIQAKLKSTSLKKDDFFNKISKHQDLLFDISYDQNKISLPNSKINFDENISLGLNINGKNNHQYKTIKYNLNGGLKITTHGVGKINSEENKSLSLKPTYLLTTNLSLTTKHIPFSFGPSLSFTERSLTQETDDQSIRMRRDQIVWIGFDVKKSFKFSGFLYHAKVSYARKVLQNTITNESEFETAQLNSEMKVNLTKNYMTGVFFKAINYDQTSINSEAATGIKFSYIIN